MVLCSVADSMESDHNKLDKMLSDLNSVEKPEYADFKRFKWEFEKHMFIEENVIFSMLRSQTMDDSVQTMALLKDHDMLLKMLATLESMVRKHKRVKFNGFIESLSKHKATEDEVFYPKLDRELSLEDRKRICRRLTLERKALG